MFTGQTLLIKFRYLSYQTVMPPYIWQTKFFNFRLEIKKKNRKLNNNYEILNNQFVIFSFINMANNIIEIAFKCCYFI